MNMDTHPAAVIAGKYLAIAEFETAIPTPPLGWTPSEEIERSLQEVRIRGIVRADLMLVAKAAQEMNDVNQAPQKLRHALMDRAEDLLGELAQNGWLLVGPGRRMEFTSDVHGPHTTIGGRMVVPPSESRVMLETEFYLRYFREENSYIIATELLGCKLGQFRSRTGIQGRSQP